MDPLAHFPSEICDSILSHLKGRELLYASLVSKNWYSVIGESPKAMQKVNLNLSWSHKITNVMADILINSTRRYQNIVVKLQSISMDDFQSIMEQKCRNWKKVHLAHITFNSAEHLVEVFKIFQNTVEELKLNILFVNSGFGLEALNFPKLKKLNLTNNVVNNSTVNEIFVNCMNLEKLCIISDDIAEQAINPMKTILKNNHKLKHLEIISQQVNSVFNEEMSYEFKLDTFISNSYNCSPSGANFKQLVAQQFDSLKVFSVDRIDCPDTMKLIFKMPKLKCLNISNVDTRTMILSHNLLSVNKSIEELNYGDIRNDFNFMQCLVDAVPNLKKIEMYSLTQNMTEYMSSSLKELEVLSLHTLEATNLSSKDLFPKLKKIETLWMFSTLIEHISSIPDDNCNPLVNLLKQSGYFKFN